MSNNLLIIVDMQNDFIDGSLGSKEAQAIVPNVVDKIDNWDGDIISTKDTHNKNYLQTQEGRYLPIPHCIEGSKGHKLNSKVIKAIKDYTARTFSFHHNYVAVDKGSFGSTLLPEMILINGAHKRDYYDYIEFVGLCTDICVVSNALIVKANFPEVRIAVDSSCCAGTTPELHNAALAVMKSCQIEVY